ncbi:protein HOTHEAD-like [Pyrus ussuriensis x Pyrus communis]|uniref:Protein HOTHEAD-like n=1 Tax=Pyrus ussuriensis x Pyrus communis TaxID=2448454 RepID=A0A5N5FCB9_9ROSA|nr:protein HOTHEAD-like [Pyrus ussuriensis x Pyrus communis]
MCIRLFGAYLLAGILLLLPIICYSDKASDYTFVREAKSTPAVVHFDYIGIGGGTTGCPLAATLSHGASVLVLERGGSPYGNPNIINTENFAPTLLDTSPTSPAQQFTSEDGVFNIRTRVLGGGSALNARFYTRASTHYIKEVGWNQRMVDQSYEWVEKVVAFEPEILQWESTFRDGLLEVGVLPRVYLRAFTHSSRFASVCRPRKITVYLHATVQKMLFRHIPAYGVIYKDAYGIIRHRAYLKRNSKKNRIVLSVGLLMISGMGSAFHLRAHSIKVVADCPMVGQGMADNPMNILFIPSPQPVEVSLVQVGWRIDPFHSFGLWLIGHFKHFLSQVSISPGVILEKIMGPLSRGHLALRNTNPNDNPFVIFNYFKEPEDLRKCIEGMKTIIDVVNSEAYSKFRYKYMPVEALIDLLLALPLNRRRKHANVTFSLEQFCIDTVMTICHYHGGCRVGRVVDKGYRVPGIDSLRVVDGLTFYRTLGTNPQATVMMLGRHMGQRILHDGLLRGSKKKN